MGFGWDPKKLEKSRNTYNLGTQNKIFCLEETKLLTLILNLFKYLLPQSFTDG
jgi:hypothetical protein